MNLRGNYAESNLQPKKAFSKMFFFFDQPNPVDGSGSHRTHDTSGYACFATKIKTHRVPLTQNILRPVGLVVGEVSIARNLIARLAVPFTREKRRK